MASIALTIIGRIGHLLLELFLRVRCFHSQRREQKLEFFYSHKKTQEVRWGEVLSLREGVEG